jgi:hypothetical protein
MTGIQKRLQLLAVVFAITSSTIMAQGGVSYSINSITPLNFGNVMPGATVSINPSTTQAAVISIKRNSSGNATSNLNIALPVSFTSGSYSIPITINTSDVQLIANNGTATNPTTLSNISFALGGGNNKTLEVRIGGSVMIPSNTIPGLYTGTFTISISNTAL